jgi:hypothetical protein
MRIYRANIGHRIGREKNHGTLCPREESNARPISTMTPRRIPPNTQIEQLGEFLLLRVCEGQFAILHQGHPIEHARTRKRGLELLKAAYREDVIMGGER